VFVITGGLHDMLPPPPPPPRSPPAPHALALTHIDSMRSA